MHQLQKIQRLTVLIGVLLLIIKFAAYSITSSNTILTDALESIVNVVAGSFGLFSLSISALPQDENHPYGHGKIEFISAAVEGILICIAGAGILYKSVYNLFLPNAIQSIDLGIYITGFAGLINYLLGFYVEKEGRTNDSAVLIASGEHLKSDGYSTLGMLLGLGLLWFTGWVWLDSAIALIFGFIVGFTGIKIIQSSVSGIMDEVDLDLVKKVVEVLDKERHINWIDVHNLRIIKYGAALHIDCHLTVPWYFSTVEAHDEVHRLEEIMRSQTAKRVELFIHVDPCLPSSCNLCQQVDCSERKAVFSKIVHWEVQNIMMNQKHYIE